MISHVFKKAEEANIGEVIVAAADQEIADDVKQNGGQAILTKKEHKTGTDRVFEALQSLEDSIRSSFMLFFCQYRLSTILLNIVCYLLICGSNYNFSYIGFFCLLKNM